MIDKSITTLPGIGPSKEKLFNKIGIHTIEDLLRYYPRRYEDRSLVKSIADLLPNEEVSIRAFVKSNVMSKPLSGRRSMQKVTVSDGTGNLGIFWFNKTFLKRSIIPNKEYIFFGKTHLKGRQIEMLEPVFEPASESFFTQRIVPIYPLTAGLTQKMVQLAIRHSEGCIETISETLSEDVRSKYDLCDIQWAIRNIHFPDSFEDFERARYRLAFEELYVLNLRLAELKNKRKAREPIANTEFELQLPFSLTGAQKRAISEISQDMFRPVAMRRLVQGDVGCGKTVVAAAAMGMVCNTGAQSVIMVPTEILARQHYASLSRMLSDTVLLVGKMPAKDKREALERIKSGDAKCIVGTHALLQETVEFHDLQLVITDEQHRFGVEQRRTLEDKASVPHVLVMTATPIPRTLGMLLYGDLDLTIIDELPAGRKPIKTYAVDESYRQRIQSFIRKEVESGRQAYIICPAVEESEELDIKAATEYAKQQVQIYPDLKIGLIHGKLTPSEKEDIMQTFSDGEIDILVSTTVVEVGVDVPNASVIIVENADRFGLSQLHQLRGRVGRGEHQAYCVLFNDSQGDVARQRMKVITKTCDGFKIAEKDLELRGPGDFFGTRQHGLPEMKIANLYTDIDIILKVREAVGTEENIKEVKYDRNIF